MTSRASGDTYEDESSPPSVPICPPYDDELAVENSRTGLSTTLQNSLLDADAWAILLAKYGRTISAAVALSDCEGHILGICHNAQPVWTLIHDAAPDWSTGCPFCITARTACTAVAEALRTGAPAMTRDPSGLLHIAVPLTLGTHHLGAKYSIATRIHSRCGAWQRSMTLRRSNFGMWQ
jgi:hypothetical protein